MVQSDKNVSKLISDGIWSLSSFSCPSHRYYCRIGLSHIMGIPLYRPQEFDSNRKFGRFGSYFGLCPMHYTQVLWQGRHRRGMQPLKHILVMTRTCFLFVAVWIHLEFTCMTSGTAWPRSSRTQVRTPLFLLSKSLADVHGLNCINECLAYLTGIFSSLCWFSLPDIFEDKISEWMNAFMAIMNQDPLTMSMAPSFMMNP